MSVERTLVLVKPDGVERKLVGEVLGRIERKGFTLVALRMLTMTEELASRHYAEHVGKAFYAGLVEFMTSGPLVAAVIEGPDAIVQWRNMMGATDPVAAPTGSIRGDFAVAKSFNVTHGSDSPEAAAREIGIFFPEL